jgi:DNA-binding transcriptional LysR family regulator
MLIMSIMNDSLPADVDLNLLQTFITIYETGSITQAAAELNVSQPAVSHGLARLRRRFDDRLFVRESGQMRPTPAATDLFAAVAGPLHEIRHELAGVLGFHPDTTTRLFRIALTDLGEVTLLPLIVRALRSEAPGARLEVVPVNVQQIGRALAVGDVDVGIASTLPPLIEHYEVLFTDHYGCLAPTSLDATDGRISREAFRTMPWATVAPDTGHSLMQREAIAAGMPITPRVVVRSFAALPALVASEGCLAAVPMNAFARMTPRPNVLILEPPYPAPSTDVFLLAAHRQSTHPARRWFVDLVRRAARLPSD